MKPPSRHRSVLLLLVAAFVAAGVGAIFKAADALPEVELSTIDTRFGIRGATDPRSDVVIVGIDDRTLEEDPNVSFPFNRRRHARVIRQLTKAGASVIAYDVQFTEPGPYPDADEALLQAVRAGKKRVVLSTTEVGLDGSTSIFGGGETLKYSRAIPAITNFTNDEDGVLRHMSFEQHQLKTFAMAAARVHEGHVISTPGSNSARIDYAGPAGTVPQLSFGEVERGSFDPDAVRGKIVVVGATATALGDLHKTAADDALSGPEVQASAIATALDGFPLHTAGWVDWLLILAMASIAPVVAMRFGTAVALIVGVIAVPAFLVGAQLAFNAGVIVSIIPPLAAAFTSLVGTVLVANPASSPWVNRVLDRVSSGEGMNLRTRRLRALMLVGTAFFVLVFGLAFQAGNVLERLELVTVDNRFDIRGTQPPGPVTVVAIDDETFNELGSAQWPFTRALHTKVIRQLKKAGAKVIIYDVQFTEPSGNDDNDTALIDAVRAAGNVVLSSTEISEDGSTRIFGGGEALEYSRGIPGNGNVENDVDGRVRRVPYDSQKLESLSMAALRAARNGSPVPHPPGDSAWIDYAGPPRTVPYLSFGRVAKGKFPASAVRGKYVVVGASAPSLQDLHQTSTTGSGEMPGPEVWANAITTGLNGFPLDTISWWKDSLLLALLAVITPLAALRMRTGLALGLGAAVLVAFLVGAQIAFNDGAIVMVIYPLLAALLAMAATAGIHGLTVAFERANTRDAFARFVPESVVDQVLQDADGARLGGVRGEATVMFSDLRGFTSFAETLEPEQVIASLNLYLTAMSEAILDHGGTLVAYMGDGIMAVFGAPLYQEDHADRALAAARDMLDRLVGFNDALRQDSLHQGFKMGIGLNTGAVMSGNVGSERRLEYTALGDTTNTAARLEGMTKGTPYQLYVSDSTRAALTRPADDLVEVGEFEVRGRKAKIKLWSLPEDEGDSPPPPPPAAADTDTEGGQSPAPATVTDGS